jgi:CubicO group peptidase (beta-lactamase class C family)
MANDSRAPERNQRRDGGSRPNNFKRRADLVFKCCLNEPMKPRSLLLLLLSLAFVSFGRGQDLARMDQVVQSYVARGQFMGSVLVARGDQIVLSKGYGSANLEWNVPNDSSTKFRLGSVTKQFTAASILLLGERGKLKVDDPVKSHYPDAPAAWDKITIFNLLTHTSGIPSFTEFPDYAKGEPFPATPEELVARFRDKPLEFEPGTKWRYSNSGYVLLGYLIERISGQKYAKFVQENIFQPLGMRDSGYDSNDAIILHRAAGYAPGSGGPRNAGFIDMSIPFSAGSLYSTTEDLLRWERGLFGGKVLSDASLRKMTTPFLGNYAFGLMVEFREGRRVISHGGGIEGFNTYLAYYPEDQVTVVVLGNLNGQAPEAIGGLLGDLAHGQQVQLSSEIKSVEVPPETLAHYVGAYQMAPGLNMLVTLDGGQLLIKLGNQKAVPVFPESETMFFAKVVDAKIEFAKPDAEGVPSQLILHQNGRDQAANRLSEAEFRQIETETKEIADAAAAAIQRFKGQTQDPRTEAALRRDIDELRLGQPKYEKMSSGLAYVTRQQLPQLKAMMARLGAVESVTFKGVGPGGADIYEVKFEHGSTEWRILMQSDEKIASVSVRAQ